ncbi:methyl-accepting chemotaxis sensory transducer with Pas/Pac sensor [Candidatus Moduliflexus flocculans]|uniref:Methyl-accepting chemotaxis sensory transducer with Pas/Pac sensor n=1 Tax=Candidatus Moduliflexus flocculans TaxID=1499966 RepID=A0A0S6W4W6_9BACT|nr:methyl-accepting chemotaxis sensory transducer with Pas/Pac sensor [Candidatus Moduliflexus flocculans]
MRMTLGTKFALLLSLVIACIMLIFGMISIYEQQKTFTALSYAKAEGVVKQLAITLQSPLWDANKDYIELLLRSYLEDPEILSIEVKELENTVSHLAKSQETNELVDLTKNQAQPIFYNNQAIRKTGEIVYNEEVIGRFEVVFSTKFISTQIHKTSLMTGTVFFALLGVETCTLFLLIRRFISLPLKTIVQASLQIAEGDIDATLPIVKSQDEIGTLNAAFHKTLVYIRQMAEIATKIAAGDLNHRIVPRSERDVLGHTFQDMTTYLQEMATAATTIAEGDLRQEIRPKTDSDALGQAFQRLTFVRDIIRQIMQSSERLGIASGALSRVSAQMAAGAEQTSQQANFVSSSSQKISQNVTEISSATEQLAASIREISHKVLDIESIVMRSVETANSANATIIRLEESSQEIGDIVKVITTITQQTNLLALNASIEAARVGDAGKGFAVVANEIKELARETARSAEGIIHKIETIQANTTEASEAISQVTAITQQVHELSLSVATAIEEQAATTNTISHNVADTADGSSEITRTITEVASVISQTSEQASSVQSAVQELTGLAEQLRQLVGKFQV